MTKILFFLLGRILRRTYTSLPISLASAIATIVARIKGHSIRFKAVGEGYVRAIDGSNVRYSANGPRAFVLWGNGFNHRGRELASQYFLNRFSLPKDALVIDVGANMGDLQLALNLQPQQYFAFEPSPRVCEALKRSIPGAHVFNVAAGDINDYVELFLADDSGDSSVVRPAGRFTDVVTVKMRRLDSMPEITSANEIGLLKVEAEGFEPEVLIGCDGFLGKTRFVAVDGGPERGTEQLATVQDTVNFLLNRGFELREISLKSRPGVALFENIAMHT